DGKFLWPGFGENLRVLRWIIDRCVGQADATETPIGYLPRPEDLDVSGLDISPQTLEQLLAVDPAQWRTELRDLGEYLEQFGDRLPKRLREEYQRVLDALD